MVDWVPIQIREEWWTLERKFLSGNSFGLTRSILGHETLVNSRTRNLSLMDTTLDGYTEPSSHKNLHRELEGFDVKGVDLLPLCYYDCSIIVVNVS